MCNESGGQVEEASRLLIGSTSLSTRLTYSAAGSSKRIQQRNPIRMVELAADGH
jgi:hypothetical protein